MTRDEVIAMIQLQLAFRTDQEDNIITVLKATQEDLENQAVKPWFLLSERMTTSTTAAEQRIPLPMNFLLEHEEDGISYVPSDGTASIPLTKNDLDTLKKLYGVTTGTPEAYALDGSYFRIFPIPDDVYLVEMYCYLRDTALDTNIENGWLKWAWKLMAGEAGKMIAGPLRDKEAYRIFSEWAKEGKANLYRENEARKHANVTYQIGGSH